MGVITNRVVMLEQRSKAVGYTCLSPGPRIIVKTYASPGRLWEWAVEGDGV